MGDMLGSDISSKSGGKRKKRWISRLRCHGKIDEGADSQQSVNNTGAAEHNADQIKMGAWISMRNFVARSFVFIFQVGNQIIGCNQFVNVFSIMSTSLFMTYHTTIAMQRSHKVPGTISEKDKCRSRRSSYQDAPHIIVHQTPVAML